MEVRLALAKERIRWDRLRNECRELGFQRSVGRGLRYVAVPGMLRVGLAGWQAGALKCRSRDRFIGWKPSPQYDRLHLVASNTRLLLRPEPGAFPKPGSYLVGGMLRRLSDDWQASMAIRWSWRNRFSIRRSMRARCTGPRTGSRWVAARVVRVAGAARRIRMASRRRCTFTRCAARSWSGSVRQSRIRTGKCSSSR